MSLEETKKETQSSKDQQLAKEFAALEKVCSKFEDSISYETFDSHFQKAKGLIKRLKGEKNILQKKFSPTDFIGCMEEVHSLLEIYTSSLKILGSLSTAKLNPAVQGSINSLATISENTKEADQLPQTHLEDLCAFLRFTSEKSYDFLSQKDSIKKTRDSKAGLAAARKLLDYISELESSKDEAEGTIESDTEKDKEAGELEADESLKEGIEYIGLTEEGKKFVEKVVVAVAPQSSLEERSDDSEEEENPIKKLEELVEKIEEEIRTKKKKALEQKGPSSLEKSNPKNVAEAQSHIEEFEELMHAEINHLARQQDLIARNKGAYSREKSSLDDISIINSSILEARSERAGFIASLEELKKSIRKFVADNGDLLEGWKKKERAESLLFRVEEEINFAKKNDLQTGEFLESMRNRVGELSAKEAELDEELRSLVQFKNQVELKIKQINLIANGSKWEEDLTSLLTTIKKKQEALFKIEKNAKKFPGFVKENQTQINELKIFFSSQVETVQAQIIKKLKEVTEAKEGRTQSSNKSLQKGAGKGSEAGGSAERAAPTSDKNPPDSLHSSTPFSKVGGSPTPIQKPPASSVTKVSDSLTPTILVIKKELKSELKTSLDSRLRGNDERGVGDERKVASKDGGGCLEGSPKVVILPTTSTAPVVIERTTLVVSATPPPAILAVSPPVSTASPLAVPAASLVIPAEAGIQERSNSDLQNPMPLSSGDKTPGSLARKPSLQDVRLPISPFDLYLQQDQENLTKSKGEDAPLTLASLLELKDDDSPEPSPRTPLSLNNDVDEEDESSDEAKPTPRKNPPDSLRSSTPFFKVGENQPFMQQRLSSGGEKSQETPNFASPPVIPAVSPLVIPPQAEIQGKSNSDSKGKGEQKDKTFPWIKLICKKVLLDLINNPNPQDVPKDPQSLQLVLSEKLDTDTWKEINSNTITAIRHEENEKGKALTSAEMIGIYEQEYLAVSAKNISSIRSQIDQFAIKLYDEGPKIILENLDSTLKAAVRKEENKNGSLHLLESSLRKLGEEPNKENYENFRKAAERVKNARLLDPESLDNLNKLLLFFGVVFVGASFAVAAPASLYLLIAGVGFLGASAIGYVANRKELGVDRGIVAVEREFLDNTHFAKGIVA